MEVIAKYCHQCRQKQTNTIRCVKKKGNKTCTIKICPACLLNRYQLSAEDIVAKGDWVCPRCRGVCDCSVCMTKQGKKPTGKRKKNEDASSSQDVGQQNAMNNGGDGNVERKTKKIAAVKTTRAKPARGKKEEVQLEEVKLPEGTSSFTISGIDVPHEDVGNVLQFLEFCSTFGKALDLRTGQADCVIREMFSGRTSRKQQYSTLTQTMIQIMSVILEDRGETSVSLSATENDWFIAVGQCVMQSRVKLDHKTAESFQEGLAGYETLESSNRLELLNFLCDEALSTTVLRKCIDNVEATERRKEAKEKLVAAKEKEKQLKQKMQDELIKAELENNGVPLTIQERDAVASQMNAENDEVRSEILTAMGMRSKKAEDDEAIRTKPVEIDENGRMLWKLKCYNEEPNILVQDFENRSDGFPKEKWSTFKPEQKPEIEKYISFLRVKRRREKKKAKTTNLESQ